MDEKQPTVIKGTRIDRERSSQSNFTSDETRLSKYNPTERPLFREDSFSRDRLSNRNRQSSYIKPYTKTSIKPRSSSRFSESRDIRQDTLKEGASENSRESQGFNSSETFRSSKARSKTRLYPRSTVEHVPRSRPGYYSSSISRDIESTPKINKLVKQVGISVIVLVLIFLLSLVKLPFTQNLVGYVKVALTEDYDFDDALGKLKFVGDYIPDIKGVFSSQEKSIVFNVPASGEVIRKFGEHVSLGDGDGFDSEGIDISTEKNADFFASADGKIASFENHDVYGQSLWIEHSDNTFSFYGGCGELTVKKGQSVKQGEKLGSLRELGSDNSMLHFQIWIDNEPVDPLTILNMGSKVSGQEGV